MENSGEFSPLGVLATLWRSRWVIAASAAVSVALGAVLAFTATPQYRATVVLAPSDEEATGLGLANLAGQFGGLASFAGISLGSGEIDKSIAVALLTSRMVLEQFVVENDLMPLLFQSRWDASQQRWKPSRFGDPPTMDDAVSLLRRHVVTVTEDRRSGLLTLSVTWRDRELAAAWANELVSRVNAVSRRHAIEESRRSRTYLRAELEKTDVVGLRDAINRLLEAQLKSEMMAVVRSEHALRTIDPARVPDANSFVKPRRIVIIGFSAFLGLGLGLMFALIRNAVVAGRET